MLGNCQKNSLCSSLQCGVSSTDADITFSSLTFFPCSIPPTVNIVMAGSQGVEISENLTISKNISFMTINGTLNTRIEHPNESFIGFGVSIFNANDKAY